MACVAASDVRTLPNFRIGVAGVSREMQPARAGAETLPVSIELVTERAEFDALEADWNDLFRRAGNSTQLFQTFNWNWHWANHYLPGTASRSGASLAMVTVRREGRLVMLWPLVRERLAGVNVLQWMGDPASQYGDVLAEDLGDRRELLHEAWRFITVNMGADCISLRKVRADAVVAPLLRELGVHQTDSTEAPYLDLSSAPDFAKYEQRYTGKARKNRRRLARRLSEQGPLAFERHTGGAAAREAAPCAIALKRQWAKSTGRLSIALADERFAAFFADVAESRIRPAGCGVTVLKSNGNPAGIAIDVTCGTHRAAHVIVHDPRLDSFSPGTLLLEAWIKGASADGIATFDLLAPAYAYKLDWADGAVAVGDFAQGMTVAGRAFVWFYLGLARPAAKSAAEALPHVLNRLRALTKLRSAAQRSPASAAPL